VKAAGDKPGVLSIVHLYLGEDGKALTEAMQYVSQATADEAVKSMMGVARVFKAADLNVTRANQFIEFAKTGKGPNPLDNPGM